MGAWGAGPFENDDAGDWVWELEDDTDATVISAALGAVIDTGADEYLEAGDANNAVAAAEIVASARGRRHSGLPTEAAVWLDAHAGLVDRQLIDLARRAVTRVAESSETRDLWDEAGDTEWGPYIADLITRLR